MLLYYTKNLKSSSIFFNTLFLTLKSWIVMMTHYFQCTIFRVILNFCVKCYARHFWPSFLNIAYYFRYDRIPRVSEWAGEASSDHRKNRIEALAVPSSVGDVLRIIGDTGDKGFPIYRSGQYPDYIHTTATGKVK